MRNCISYLLLLLLFPQSLFAQTSVNSEKHWQDRLFIQLRGGANLSMNEDIRFGELKHAIRWGTDIAVGKEFTPYWGVAVDVAYNKNTGMAHYSIVPHIYNSFNSDEVYANVTYNLTNAFLGLRRDRKAFIYAHLGLGVAYTFGLDDRDYANAPKDNNFAVGIKFGLTYVYNFNRRIAAIADASLSGLTDGFNGRVSGVPFDMRANVAVGIRLHFGKGATSWVDEPSVKYVERIVHRVDTVRVFDHIVEQIKEAEPIEQYSSNAKIYSIFFALNSIDIRESEQSKIAEMAKYLNENPQKVVFVLGHADKDTGTQAINYYLGKNRSLAVSNYLIDVYKIAPSRIINITEEGDKVQPYKINTENNRVAICIISDFTE